MGKGEYDFSEMYIVHQTYLDRADAAVRTHGDVSFSQGGSFYDVIYGMKKFGLVPEEVMRPGVMYGDTLSNHTELTAVSDAVVAAIAKGKLRKLQTDNNHNPLWKKAIAAIHDIYLGKCPEKFTYKGKEYTPHSFFESTGLNPNDYISLTSYTIRSTNHLFLKFKTTGVGGNHTTFPLMNSCRFLIMPLITAIQSHGDLMSVNKALHVTA